MARVGPAPTRERGAGGVPLERLPAVTVNSAPVSPTVEVIVTAVVPACVVALAPVSTADVPALGVTVPAVLVEPALVTESASAASGWPAPAAAAAPDAPAVRAGV